MAEREKVPDLRRNWAVIVLRGSLDDATVDRVEREIHLLESRNARLIVDVTGLHFLGDFGVDVLVLLAHHLHRRNGRMALVDGRGYMRQVLGETGLEDLLPLFATVADAVAGLQDDCP